VYPFIRSLLNTWNKQVQPHVPDGVLPIALITVAAASLAIGLKQLGALEIAELKAYDAMIQMRPEADIDPRLLIVTITEEDLRAEKRTTPSDRTLAKALENLQRQQPEAIGLDLYRDIPQEPGTAELRQQLQNPKVITITKLGNSEEDTILPPPGVPEERISFNDLLIDSDGVIRRNLLYGGNYASFSLTLALRYLATQGITPEPSPFNADDLKLGEAIFVGLETNSGGYQYNDAKGYQILLNYHARQVARRVTLAQVLNGTVKPEWVKGKVVLIGTTAVSSKDLFYTPYSAAAKTDHQMSGVEIHGQMVSQILSAASNQRSLFWYLPEWSEWVWVMGWAVMGSCLAWWIRHPLGLGVTDAGTLVLLGGSSFLFLLQDGWVPVMTPAIAFSLSTVGMVTYRAQQSQRQHQMVMTLLGQNTSKEIADALWENRDRLIESGKLPGQKLIATMLFTDIQGFSTISEQMSPEELLNWLNEYLEVMTEEVLNFQGIINKFTGDGLLAVFGVPIPRSDPKEIAQDAQHAVACALAMGDRLQQLNLIWQKRGLPSVQMRVGIFTGETVVGSLGGKDRLEYGIIGDSVNIASRLESCAKERQVEGCRILIAEETLTHLQGQFQVESWGAMALRGKQQTVEVYRVMGEPQSSVSSDRPVINS
jgi:adenylate cyclase